MKNKKLLIGVIACIVIIGAAYFIVQNYFSGYAKKSVDVAFAKASQFADIDYSNVNYSLLTSEIDVHDVKIHHLDTQYTTYIDTIVVTDIDKEKEIPSHMSFKLNGIHFDKDTLDKNIVNSIEELGYSFPIKTDFEFSYKYNEKEKNLVIETIRFGSPDIGTIESSLHVGNIDLNNAFQLIFTYPQLLMYSGDIRYIDHSLFNRTIKAKAKRQNVSEEDVKKQILQKLDQDLQQENLSPFTKDILTKFKNFVNNPSKIEISLSTKNPVPLGRLLRSQEMLELGQTLQ